MKKILSVVFALLVGMMVICIPVGAVSFDKVAKDFESGKTIKTTFKKGDTRYYKLNVTKKGKLDVHIIMESGSTFESGMTCYMYDGKGNQVNTWFKFANSGGMADFEQSFDVSKGTYYVSITRASEKGTGETKITFTYPSDENDKSAETCLAVKLKKGEALPLSSLTSGKETKVSLSTSDSKIAKVDSDGVVTAASKGTAIITVKSGKKSYKLAVIVE